MSISTLFRMGFAVLATIVLSATLASRAAAADAGPAVVKPYPLAVCVVEGEMLGPDTTSVIYKNQEVKFCCKGCMKKFNTSPDKYLAKIEAAVKEQNAGKK
jgi:hypothetical protein